MSKTIIQTDTDIRRILNSSLIIPNEPDRKRISDEYQGRKDLTAVITVTLKED